MKLEHVLHEFSKKNGLGDLKVDAAGKCSLSVNDSLFITFETSLTDHGFFIYSTIGQIPLERENEFYRMALEGNLFHKETSGATIGYFHPNRALILFLHFEEADARYAAFEKKFESFIYTLVHWKNKLGLEPAQEFNEIPVDKNLAEPKDKKIFYA